MAQKRKAREAFGDTKPPLSAFAAAKLAKSSQSSSPAPAASRVEKPSPGNGDLAAALAWQPCGDDSESAYVRSGAGGVLDDAVSKRAPAVQLSSFRMTRKNVLQDDATALELTLANEETVTFVGEYDLVVTCGIVTVSGAVLNAASLPQRVYAPTTHALPQIQARQDGTVIRVSNVQSGLRKLERLSPLFRNIWALGDRSFELLESSHDDLLQRVVNTVAVDQNMDAVLRALSAKTTVEPKKPRILAIGAKASGKSTFNRILCNHLLSWTSVEKCQYLDLDPGQPEFGTPGLISLVEVSSPLLGPSFTHTASKASSQYRSLRSHAIAATSFKDDPEHYKACVLDLARCADSKTPIVINSCGWVTGMGADVLLDLIENLSVTDVVMFEPLDSQVIDAVQRKRSAVSVYRVARRPPQSSSRTPAEHRAMQNMAYFHSRTFRNISQPRWNSKPISKVRPWIVSYAKPDSGILAIASYGQQPSAEFLGEVLDGSVVAISSIDEDEATVLTTQIEYTSDELPCIKADTQGIVRTLDPSQSQCLGLALVRAVDTARKQIQLVTPLQEKQIAALLDRKVVLVRGGFDPPEWAYLEDIPEDNGVDPNSASLERPWVSRQSLVGVEGAVWRLRHPPMADAGSIR